MKFTLLALAFTILTLPACNPTPPPAPATPEERTLFTILDKIEWGLGYDRHCIGHGRDMEGYLYANAQQLVLQLGNMLIAQRPENVSEENHEAHIIAKLDAYTDDLRPQIDAAFKGEDCTSQSTSIQEAKRAHTLFNKTPPAKMNIVIQQQIERAINAAE